MGRPVKAKGRGNLPTHVKVDLEPAWWHRERPGKLLLEAARIVDSGVWAEAAVKFHEERQAKRKTGEQAPKGAQRYVNAALKARFLAAGWTWDDGRCHKGDCFVRITFRHQMSLEADLYEALRMHKDSGCEQVAVLAADKAFLQIITPNDAAALCSYQKFEAELDGSKALEGVPLFLGRLTPKSQPPDDVGDALRFLPRFRDKGVPVN